MNKKGHKFLPDKTKESLYTLFSLYILIQQAFESLTDKEDIMLAEFDSNNPIFTDMVSDTIREALIYQILLKACAFIDEWNGIFGIKTEIYDQGNILTVKRIAKPAFKCIAQWKSLRNFRNEAIAHNHRNKQGENIYLNHIRYHSPQSIGEIYLLVFCLKQIMDIVHFFFKESLNDIITKLRENKSDEEYVGMDEKEIDKKSKQVTQEISLLIKEYVK